MKKLIYSIVFVLILHCTLKIENCPAQWDNISQGLKGGFFNSVAIINNNILAGSFLEGVFISTNNGSNWTNTSLNSGTIWCLAVNGNIVFAGTERSKPLSRGVRDKQ